MNRREFIGSAAAVAAFAPEAASAARRSPKRPLAIAMWDFSWLERRWPGAGYEDWDEALDQLAERGYDAVRIDAFPHLHLAGASRTWTLVPVWTEHAWGSPGRIVVRVQPELNQFVAACKRRKIKVALSSWYRDDTGKTRMALKTPDRMAAAWIATLRALERDGLLDSIVFVDLCNEYPGPFWAPYLSPQQEWGNWPAPVALRYINAAMDGVRAAYPGMPLCFSSDRADIGSYLREDVSRLDLIEHHVWASTANDREFDRLIDYKYENFKPDDYERMAAHGERTYRARPAYWQGLVSKKIEALADVSRRLRLPLATTEGWAVINYKDWPMLDWGWIKELCASGVDDAVASARFAAICTSNFCGPQHQGMWRDVAWHRALTRRIKRSRLAPDLQAGRLYERL